MNYVDKLKDILKHEGLRYTKQRQYVWDEIRSSSEHRDAEEIYIQINKASKLNRSEKVSRATVYRTIDVLVKNNLVRKMELGDGRALYEHKIEEEHHDHIICVETGKIIEFFNEELEEIEPGVVQDLLANGGRADESLNDRPIHLVESAHELPRHWQVAVGATGVVHREAALHRGRRLGTRLRLSSLLLRQPAHVPSLRWSRRWTRRWRGRTGTLGAPFRSSTHDKDDKEESDIGPPWVLFFVILFFSSMQV